MEFTTHAVAELKKNTIFVCTFHAAFYVLKCRSLFTMMKKDGTVTITYFEKKNLHFLKYVYKIEVCVAMLEYLLCSGRERWQLEGATYIQTGFLWALVTITLYLYKETASLFYVISPSEDKISLSRRTPGKKTIFW